MLALFDRLAVDEMVVVDAAQHVVGVVTERHACRRYFEKLESAQRDIFGET
jgi:CIC family chloride channel protein